MIRKKIVSEFIKLSALMVATLSTAYATANNFNCPSSAEIQSTDFTAPSIWVAPPVAHSAPGVVGVGLGGKEAKELIGTEVAMVNHKPGWVCVYRSQGGLSVLEYQYKIKQVVESHPFLRKYLVKTNKIVERGEPYLKKYLQHPAIGFVGYHKG